MPQTPAHPLFQDEPSEQERGMHLIGTIARLQLQASSLKVGDSPRRYDPAPLREVSALALTSAGVAARAADGTPLLDVHHQDHPASKHVRGVNGISFGFTTHYAAMRGRFGPHLVDGIAGENLLIASDRAHTADEFARGLLVTADDGRHILLQDIIIAAPCVEFTRFALRFPQDATPDTTVTEGLQFLHHGTRGFYATLASPPQTIRLGDRVYLP
jgi:hypothetical protein